MRESLSKGEVNVEICFLLCLGCFISDSISVTVGQAVLASS